MVLIKIQKEQDLHPKIRRVILTCPLGADPEHFGYYSGNRNFAGTFTTRFFFGDLQTSLCIFLLSILFFVAFQECASEKSYCLAMQKEGLMEDLVKYLNTSSEQLKMLCANAIFRLAEEKESRHLVKYVQSWKNHYVAKHKRKVFGKSSHCLKIQKKVLLEFFNV